MSTASAETSAQAPPKFIRPNFDRMPPELTLLKNWVLWGAVWNGSKWTKRPIQISGYAASTTKPKHWSSFDEVKKAYERAVQRGYMELREKGKPVQQVPVGGVGFIFHGQPDTDGLVFAGVDFDKVIPPKGEISSFAAERVKRLGSYFEPSVSGTGLHVILKARPLARGITHNGTELYTDGRFFTMTGRAPEHAKIVAAPDAFAALADELEVQTKNSQRGASTKSPENDEPPTDDGTNAWFGKLSPENQSEIVRYAALHIAGNSKLFELTEHGGKYQEYLKLAFAIARSRVADAEAIFVEAASTAKNAESADELRTFFQKCASAAQPTDGITVGTLLHLALQCGATFSKWKQEGRATTEVRFVPGNEAICREALDKMVAADERTFVLDGGGPLAILRVPDKEALEEEGVRWEGDLPGTTLATSADIMERAEKIRWMRKSEDGFFRRTALRATLSTTTCRRCVGDIARVCSEELPECHVSTTTAIFI